MHRLLTVTPAANNAQGVDSRLNSVFIFRRMDAITFALEQIGGPGDLARKLGMSRQRVDNWRRRGAIPQGQVIAVAQAIDCDPVELYQRNQHPDRTTASTARASA